MHYAIFHVFPYAVLLLFTEQDIIPQGGGEGACYHHPIHLGISLTEDGEGR